MNRRHQVYRLISEICIRTYFALMVPFRSSEVTLGVQQLQKLPPSNQISEKNILICSLQTSHKFVKLGKLSRWCV